MPVAPLSIPDFAQSIKQKYPQYKDVPDTDLVNKIVEKYPQYKDRVKMDQPAQTSAPSSAPAEKPLPATSENWNAGVEDPMKSKHVDDAIDKMSQDAFAKSIEKPADEHSENQPIPKPDIKLSKDQLKQQREAFKDVTNPDSYTGRTVLEQAKDGSKDLNFTTAINSKFATKDHGDNLTPETKAKISSGEYGYDLLKQRPTLKVGAAQNFIEGVEGTYKARQKADDLASKSKEEIIKDEEADRANHDPNVPITESNGWASTAANMIGSNAAGIEKAVLGGMSSAIPGMQGAGANTLSALFMSHDAGKAAAGETFTNAYHELRNKGASPSDAYDQALDQAKSSGVIAAGQMAAMSYTGIKLAKEPFGNSVNKGFGDFLKSSVPEVAAQGGIAGVAKAVDNINRGKPITEDVATNMMGAAALVGGIHALGAGVEKLSAKQKSDGINGYAKLNPEVTEAAINQNVIQKSITPDQAENLKTQISEQRDLNKGLPDNVPDENKQKIQNRLQKIDDLKKTISPDNPEALHSAFHADVKEKIKGVEEEIAELSKPTPEKEIPASVKVIKPEDNKQPKIIEPELNGLKEIHEQLNPKDNGTVSEHPAGEMGAHTGGGESAGGNGESSGVGSGIEGNEAPKEGNESKATGEEEGAKLTIEKESADKALSGESNDVTSIKNAVTQLRRKEYGLGEEIPAAQKEFGTTWDEAKTKIENGYDPKDLVSSLKDHPRPLSDVENASLLHYQNTKELELTKTNDNINKAFESGDEDALADNKIRRLRIQDELQDIYDVNKAVGTENARGLASRKMMTDRKYNLTNMLSEKRAANGGKPLTDVQFDEINKQHAAIVEDNKNLQARIDELKNENRELKSKLPKDKNQTIKEKGKNLADKIRKLKKPKGGLSADFTLGTWDLAVEGVAQLVEKGASIADAIDKLIEQKQIQFKSQKDRESFERILNQEDEDTRIDSFADPEIFRLKAKLERSKEAYEHGLMRDENAKKSPLTRVGNTFVKWQRAFKLSNPLTMGKLLAAAGSRALTDAGEQIVGGGWSMLFPKLAKGAIGEGGGLRVKEQAKAMTQGFIRGMKDSYDIMRRGSSGKSDIDLVFGKGGQLPPEAVDLFGQLHSATKAPIKRAIFERSLAKRFRRSIANGDDVRDPLVQTSIAVGAYKDANRAIFMQDNILSKAYQAGIKSLENSKEHPVGGKFAARSLEWLIPFVKVPTNIVGETVSNIAGLPIAGAKALHATFTKGLENLSADEKDMIFRNLKKGSIGAGAMLLGYFNPQAFGGFHQEKEKRNTGDVKAGAARVFGLNIPAWAIESPVFQAMQFGATIRRVKDTKVKGEENGIGNGAWAAALGIPQKVPLIDQPYRITKTFVDPKERNYYFGELAKSTIDPAILSYVASETDPEDKQPTLEKIFNPENKRKPETILQHVETGIPGLRENVPTGKKKQSTGW